MGRRVFRISEKIREIVAREVIQHVPRSLPLVTITAVVVSPDLREAKIYWSTANGVDKQRQVQGELERGAGHYRSIVAKELGSKFTPTIKFYYDDTLDVTEQVEKLLQSVNSCD